jgi:hypothetical protein
MSFVFSPLLQLQNFYITTRLHKAYMDGSRWANMDGFGKAADQGREKKKTWVGWAVWERCAVLNQTKSPLYMST